jgi:hypothetical protein
MSLDLRAIVGKAVDTVFGVLPKEVRTYDFYHKTLGGTYNPATNSYPEEVVPGVRLIRTSFEFREMNASIIAVRDAKFICKDFGVLPKEGDYFKDALEIWDVVRLFEHPNLFVIHVRRR